MEREAYKGPTSGPTKGLAVYSIIGAASSLRSNMSPTVPPATLRKALPDNPSKNRAMSMVSMFWATAHGMSQITKDAKDVM